MAPRTPTGSGSICWVLERILNKFPLIESMWQKQDGITSWTQRKFFFNKTIRWVGSKAYRANYSDNSKRSFCILTKTACSYSGNMNECYLIWLLHRFARIFLKPIFFPCIFVAYITFIDILQTLIFHILSYHNNKKLFYSIEIIFSIMIIIMLY